MSSYEQAGVSREGAQNWVAGFSDKMKQAYRPEILSQVGDYGSFYEAPRSYKDPIWVSTTDGVGTKLMLAEEAGAHALFGVGIDCVAMCVNDLLACRAEPLIFLDYLATGKLDQERSDKLIAGILEGCRQSNCSLIGGETAEMPQFYPKNRLDVAGFSVGVLERNQRFQKQEVKVGDLILGLKSSGFHSNGYSLIRKIMQDQRWTMASEIEGENLGDYLLRPTQIYVNSYLEIFRNPKVVAAAHITGGGLVENLPRVFDLEKCSAQIDLSSWDVPCMMQAFQKAAGVEQKEAYSTWNMGIGFSIIVRSEFAEELLADTKNDFVQIGEVVAKDSSGAVVLR